MSETKKMWCLVTYTNEYEPPDILFIDDVENEVIEKDWNHYELHQLTENYYEFINPHIEPNQDLENPVGYAIRFECGDPENPLRIIPEKTGDV